MRRSLTDGDLVRQTLSGQITAYDRLTLRWTRRLLAFLSTRIERADVVEDLAQECLLRAFRSLASLGEPEKFGPWLLSIGHRAALDWRKAKARGEVSLEEVPQWGMDIAEQGPPKPVDVCAQAEEFASIRSAVDELPSPLRETLKGYYFGEWTYAELAAELGVSPATVNARLARARQWLRARLRDQEHAQ